MDKKQIECPSGLTGVIRKFKVSEGRQLADQNLALKGLVVESLITKCWVETIDPGPYPIGKNASGEYEAIDWKQILQGDRLYTLLELGIHTYGKRYDFDVNCGKCGKRIEWSLDCEEEVEIYELPEASRQKIREGNNRFELEWSGKRIWFKLPIGADERKILKVQESAPETVIEQGLMMRIVEVEGVAPGDLLDWIRDIDLGEAQDLTELFDDHDCGVETDLEVRCPRVGCMAEQVVTIPFDLDYILRSGRRRRRKSRRRLRRRGSRAGKKKTG